MNYAAMKTALAHELSRILADTAFILVEESDAALPDPGPAVEASLDFAGTHRGTCWLAVSEAGAEHLAREMLGEERVVGGDLGEHATAELLNILTGWVLDACWGEDVARSLGVPQAMRRQFADTVSWSLPAGQRVVVSTDAGFTFLAGASVTS